MIKLSAVLAASLILAGCSATAQSEKKEMVASWYMHGTRTANGERFKPDGMTAAHKTLPFGTKLRLTRRDKSVIVRINDRGPFTKGRHIDLSRGVARQLGCIHSGICKVEVEIISDDREQSK
jgi:rare lipoprotein A